MVGRAPKKRRTQASDQIPRSEESRVPPTATLRQSGPESGSSEQPLVSVSMLGDSPPAANNTVGDGPVFTMGGFTAPSAETEINSYLQNLLSDYQDLPLASPGATDSFWLATENLLPDSRPDIHGMFSSEGISVALGMSDKPTRGFPVQNAESVRPRLIERIDERVPPVYRDRSVVSNYPHVAALMKIIGCLEEQLQIPQVPIDQAMRLNRQAIATIREVSNTEEFRRCQSCPLLVATTMDLVVGLYELVILPTKCHTGEGDVMSSTDQNNLPWQQSPFEQPARPGEMPSDGSSPESGISGGSEPPLFQFGCLEFDPDEQEIFRAAMVRRDLRRYVETIQYCSQEIPQRQRQAANRRGGPFSGASQPRRSSNNAHTQWYQEMGYRAKELVAALPAQCSHR